MLTLLVHRIFPRAEYFNNDALPVRTRRAFDVIVFQMPTNSRANICKLDLMPPRSFAGFGLVYTKTAHNRDIHTYERIKYFRLEQHRRRKK